jgi:hypothetical protein
MLGLALAPALLAGSLSLLPLQMPLLTTPQMDPRVFGVTAALAAAMTLTMALGTLRATRRVAPSACDPTRATARLRGFGQTLIAAQTALAFVLTLGAILVVTSLWHVWRIDPGYDPTRIAVVQLGPRAANPADVEDAAGRLTDDLAELPGVEAIGVLGSPLLVHSRLVTSVGIQPDARPMDLHWIPGRGDLATVLGLTAIDGRLPTRTEVARADPVVLLSQRAASALWPGEAAVGRQLFMGTRTITVIGVVRDLELSGLGNPSRLRGQIHTSGLGGRQVTLLLRTTGPPAQVVPVVTRQLASRPYPFDLMNAGTMEDALAGSIRQRRFAAWTYAGIGVAALVTIGVGILGMVAMITSLRVREIGIRQALGASCGGVIALLLREQLTGVVVGLLVGGVAAWWASGLLRREVYGITPTDPLLWTAAALTIVAAASLATIVPALHASRLDPATTLRAE